MKHPNVTKLLLNCAFLAGLSVLFFSGWSFLKDPARFPVKAVEVRGQWQRTGKESIVESIMPEVSIGFFNVDVRKIHRNLRKFPWVASAKVERLWPWRLVITVTEYQPKFRFEEQGIVTDSNQFVRVHLTPKEQHLAVLSGDVQKVATLVQTYDNINAILKPLNAQLTQLNLAPRGAWTLTLNDRTKVYLGRDDILQRLRQYVRVYPKLLKVNETPLSVDLRYQNGMAVLWQPRATNFPKREDPQHG